ncbi:uncharacterized protein J7T54_008550 [Emericellopsis cladophorae]|uniref:Uncharacterized protein n=1 Tax=Emericellopsis cladophorae TaxID=2686198 RepID=A0A9P9XZQ4_9HYPO|nr:uncharacterized protein J7T54_008550 [Emericellopsis cladophorae]KAI6780631.1 hypothetical protein J7T54_008550 [Emericellopsis cladophorae]
MPNEVLRTIVKYVLDWEDRPSISIMARIKSLPPDAQATPNSERKKNVRSLLLANRKLHDVTTSIVAQDSIWFAADVRDLESIVNPLFDNSLLVSLQQIRKLFIARPSISRGSPYRQAMAEFDYARSVGRALRRMPNLEICVVTEMGDPFPDEEELRQ